jgi:hypothetical protein
MIVPQVTVSSTLVLILVAAASALLIRFFEIYTCILFPSIPVPGTAPLLHYLGLSSLSVKSSSNGYWG